MQIIQTIQNRIYEIRGERVILDRDLSALYEIESKHLNQAVKRNLNRFPKDFMFQLTKEEFDEIKFRVQALENDNPLRSQIVTSNANTGTLRLQNATSNRGGSRYLPYAFTEQGVAMLSGVLNSDKAIQMNISIMRAFVEIRRIIFRQADIVQQLQEIKERITEHDTQLSSIYDALENLLDENAAGRKWNERERIGFKK